MPGFRSRSGFRSQAAEPALAPGIFGDRALERGLVEIGPMNGNENELAIGRLPHQEIRQPLLAAGADDQIRIGNFRSVEISAKRLIVDRRRIALAFRYLGGEALSGAGDFLTRAVIERDDEMKAIVVAREIFGFLEQRADIRLQPLTLADHADSDAV